MKHKAGDKVTDEGEQLEGGAMRIVSEVFTTEPVPDCWIGKMKKQTLTVTLSDGRKVDSVLCYYEHGDFNPVEFARETILKFLRDEGVILNARS